MAYNQLRALWAITKASFTAIFSQPSSVFFSLLFPIAFIFVFAAFGNRKAGPLKLVLAPTSDTANALYQGIKANPAIKLRTYSDTTKRNDDLRKARFTAVVNISKLPDSLGKYRVGLLTSEASEEGFGQLKSMLDYMAMKAELSGAHLTRSYYFEPEVIAGKKYKTIDFILPGMLGFSVLFATLFGIAFLFYNLREQLVLKRFYASPVKKIYIVVGIGVSRLFYQLINIIVLILFGYFFLGFTLENGWITFIEMLLLSLLMLFLLMGAGLLIASISKNDTMIPLMINIFGFPQLLLSGTFFPIDVFPRWLQILCKFVPLTPFNDAMRKISFEGLHLFNCWKELGILGIWLVIIYASVIKFMKWE